MIAYLIIVGSVFGWAGLMQLWAHFSTREEQR